MRSMLTILCLFASSAHAVPGQFTHQGRLLADDGTPMTGEATITFRVINAETGGTELWKETQTVPLTNGFYAAVLGADEAENPLDTDVLQQAPVWLELQLAGEGAMYPRNPIHAVPYATISTVAKSVSGGSVNATEIAVDGTPVVDGSGNWVGPAPTVQWDDIEGMPEDFEDGTDDESDSFDALAVSCEAGDIPVLDAGSGMWVCGWDNDSLADIACTEGQLIKWSDDALGFVCAEDADTVLTAEQVDEMVADNGYAMAADVFSGSYDDLTDKPSLFSGSYEDLSDVPGWLSDGDDNDLGLLSCADGETISFNESADEWVCEPAADASVSLGSATADGIGFDSVEPANTLITTTSTGQPASLTNALISDGAHVFEVALSKFIECSECGDGSDGSVTISDLSPTAALAAGEYNFIDFTVPEGVTLTITGTEPLIIRATGVVRIEGVIDLSGADGGLLSEGGAGGGAGGPGGTDGTPGSSASPHGWGINRNYDDSWHKFSRTNLTPLSGGIGGTGNRMSTITKIGGGGGGGGALAIAASAIIISGETLLHGGDGAYTAGSGSGGTVWLRASAVSVTGLIDVAGGLATETGERAQSGVVRIDSETINDPLLDERTRGTTADLPPTHHLYQTTDGTITFANNSTETLDVDIRFIE